jgi:hypothetical protein
MAKRGRDTVRIDSKLSNNMGKKRRPNIRKTWRDSKEELKEEA